MVGPTVVRASNSALKCAGLVHQLTPTMATNVVKHANRPSWILHYQQRKLHQFDWRRACEWKIMDIPDGSPSRSKNTVSLRSHPRRGGITLCRQTYRICGGLMDCISLLRRKYRCCHRGILVKQPTAQLISDGHRTNPRNSPP